MQSQPATRVRSAQGRDRVGKVRRQQQPNSDVVPLGVQQLRIRSDQRGHLGPDRGRDQVQSDGLRHAPVLGYQLTVHAGAAVRLSHRASR